VECCDEKFVPTSPLLFSGLIIITFGAKRFSILHILLADDDVMADAGAVFAIEISADTGPLLVGPVPVWAFFGHVW
jgi:hypothetical protein